MIGGPRFVPRFTAAGLSHAAPPESQPTQDYVAMGAALVPLSVINVLLRDEPVIHSYLGSADHLPRTLYGLETTTTQHPTQPYHLCSCFPISAFVVSFDRLLCTAETLIAYLGIPPSRPFGLPEPPVPHNFTSIRDDAPFGTGMDQTLAVSAGVYQNFSARGSLRYVLIQGGRSRKALTRQPGNGWSGRTSF
ncbi:hypothetical protein CC78DRAFT_576179 [Lojkania enalia]|uniref:Uncharacterized protein n=1 Tax=Lojkania enalia TaxID=147567 RepID=A0A9P4KJE3_9PLEO|nr:hypothetical protein CC78DRAFT_576179 [Didymosphaeria enalia]